MVPWYHTQWCVMCQLFLIPPIGLVNLLCSRAFSIPAKLVSLIVVIAFMTLVIRNKNIYDDHLNGLWLAKFKQFKRDFKFEAAGEYLYRRKVNKTREVLQESLLRMDYEYSMGRFSSALIHQKEAQETHDLLFTKTLKDYVDLLITVGVNPKSSKFHNQRNDFNHYYELFLKEPNLSWDIKEYTVPAMSNILELIKDLPEKYESLTDIRKNFTVLLSSIVQSRPTSLLLPMMLEWKDIDRVKVLLARASLIHMILGMHTDLKFYFYAFASRDNNVAALEKLEKIGRNPLDALDDYVNQSPFHLKAYILRGLYFFENGNELKAKLDFEHVFKLDVNYMQVWAYLNLLNLDSKDLAAMELYKKAEDLRFRGAKFDLAVELFEELLKKEWTAKRHFKDEILFNLGVIFRNNLKLYDRAISNFEDILQIQDSFRHEEARYNLIMCHYYHGDYDSMERVTKQFLKEHSNSDRVPRLMMINVVMKLMKVFRGVLGKFFSYSGGLNV